MSQENARQQGQHLRQLYAKFLTGVLGLKHYAFAMGKTYPAVSFQALEEAHQPGLAKALENISDTLARIRVEPGTKSVCALYEDFCATFDSYMLALKSGQDREGVLARVIRLSQKYQMDTQVSCIRDAIHAHIRAVDKFS